MSRPRRIRVETDAMRRQRDWREIERLRAELERAKAELATLREMAAPRPRRGIYVASRVKYAERWRAWRSTGVPIISTWIDESDEGQTQDWADLWRRCIAEPQSAAWLVLYAQSGDVLSGALLEVGSALSVGVPVRVVGDCVSIRKFVRHPLVTRVSTLAEAFGVEAAAESANAKEAPSPAFAPGKYGFDRTAEGSGVCCCSWSSRIHGDTCPEHGTDAAKAKEATK